MHKVLINNPRTKHKVKTRTRTLMNSLKNNRMYRIKTKKIQLKRKNKDYLKKQLLMDKRWS